MPAMKLSHFHCPDCDPVFIPDRTRAICGTVIPAPVIGNGPDIRCLACKQKLTDHQASHRRARR
jgi:hypothetical protein